MTARTTAYGLELTTTPAVPGLPSAATVLLVHGICHGAWCWTRYASYLAGRGHDVVAMSLRGHGASEGRAGLHTYGLGDYTDDLIAVARSLPEPPVVVGHSMGGALVQLALRREPDVARAAVLLASMPPGGLTVREVARSLRSAGRVRALVRLFRGRPLSEEQVNRLPFFDGRLDREQAAAVAPRMQPDSRRAVRDLLGFAPSTGPLPVPVLVVGSARDALFGADVVRRTARHYGLVARVLDEGCHDLMVDPTWQTGAELIADWVAGLPA